jgi:predicted HTH transcriptional regulator
LVTVFRDFYQSKYATFSDTKGHWEIKVTDEITKRMTEKESDIFALIAPNKSVTQDEMAKKLGAIRKTISVHLKSL